MLSDCRLKIMLFRKVFILPRVLRKILREADDGKAKVTSGLLSHHAPVQSAESTAGDMEVPSAGIPEADRLSGG